MQGWGKGKKILAGLGSLFVLGVIINASHLPPKTVVNQNKSSKSTTAQKENPITVSPDPSPEPVPVPEPVQPALPPPAPPPVVTPVPAPVPVPQPAATNCTPGYSPCIAPGSDVDCAGGSGNGPRYVSGPVQVTGSDPYGLDRDGDGIGCE
jgi:hypothetical protein